VRQGGRCATTSRTERTAAVARSLREAAPRPEGRLIEGRSVREARRGSGLRQEDLALATNVSVKFISDLERGKETAPFRLVLEVVQNLDGRLEVGYPKSEQGD
jgi:ribosome-binding protein aMBF1 (putative translation factor)